LQQLRQLQQQMNSEGNYFQILSCFHFLNWNHSYSHYYFHHLIAEYHLIVDYHLKQLWQQMKRLQILLMQLLLLKPLLKPRLKHLD
jgi:hypothetical protein